MGLFSIIEGKATFTSGSTMHTGSDGAPSSSIVTGHWEVDPDDGESIQFRIPKEKIKSTHDRIAFYVSSSGRIGIGTKDPESAFDVRDIAEDVDPSRRDLKTKIFKVTKKAQEFDTPVTGSIVSASSGFIGDLTGNASSATQLATARTIGGIEFDGTRDINLPGVNARGDQDTTGTAENAHNIKVTSDTTSANHPITFIDDTTPDGSAEGLKASRTITVNPRTGAITLGDLTISFTQGDGRTTFGTVTFTAQDAGGQLRTATIDLR